MAGIFSGRIYRTSVVLDEALRRERLAAEAWRAALERGASPAARDAFLERFMGRFSVLERAPVVAKKRH